MKQIIENLFIGNQEDVPGKDFAIVSAAKNPWHADALGYTGNLKSDHPNYLIYETDRHLYLNMIDPAFELKEQWTDPMFKAAFRFIDRHIQHRPVLVRCNQGMSRSPSIVLAYVSFNEGYEKSVEKFKKSYPEYNPGKGISMYLEKGWDRILAL